MADISKDVLRKEIAVILKGANLADTSAKNVRQELEEKLDCKLQARKKEIEELVMEYVSKDKKKGKKSSDDEEDEEEEDEPEDDEEDSEEEEKKPAKRSSTGKKPAAKKRKAGSDSEASESDSDSGEDWAKAKRTASAKKSGKAGGGAKGGGAKGGGYTKALKLSPELAALVGKDIMARHEVVRKVWSIIKERNLYDPKNKQYAICDDALFNVMGVKRFRTFGMMKYLKNHFSG